MNFDPHVPYGKRCLKRHLRLANSLVCLRGLFCHKRKLIPACERTETPTIYITFHRAERRDVATHAVVVYCANQSRSVQLEIDPIKNPGIANVSGMRGPMKLLSIMLLIAVSVTYLFSQAPTQTLPQRGIVQGIVTRDGTNDPIPDVQITVGVVGGPGIVTYTSQPVNSSQ